VGDLRSRRTVESGSRGQAQQRLSVRQLVERDAGDRCGYCLSPTYLTGMPLVLEHIIPKAAGGPTRRENLWLSCYRCNEFKGPATHAIDPTNGARVALFDPRRQAWSEHFRWSPDGLRILGITSTGRATAVALRLNNAVVVTARRWWVAAGWHPPGTADAGHEGS
jgi:hypothetical protein